MYRLIVNIDLRVFMRNEVVTYTISDSCFGYTTETVTCGVVTAGKGEDMSPSCTIILAHVCGTNVAILMIANVAS